VSGHKIQTVLFICVQGVENSARATGTAVALANKSLGTELIAVRVRTNHISGERDLLTDQESLDE